jgi:ATP-dependent RNA helicase DeaD
MATNAPLLKVDRVHVVNRNIKHEFLVCGKDEKLERLVDFLKNQGSNRGMIFCRTRETANKIAQQLITRGFKVDLLHGDIMQKDRDKVMRSFKKERVQFLVATDVAARGIDVEDLAFVVHHQLPQQIEYYTHRSGRTARAGKTGVSLVLLDPRERNKIRELEDSLGIHFTETR